MAVMIGGPGRYIQGRGELIRICAHIGGLGSRLYVLASPTAKARVEYAIAKSVSEAGFSVAYGLFGGECTQSDIDRIIDDFNKKACDVLVSVGGGKTHDAAKAAAAVIRCPLVTAPTSVANCAACTSVASVYTQGGELDKRLSLPSGPDVALVDTELICQAPVRLLVAGMGGAMASYFEASACRLSGGVNVLGGKTPLAAVELARACYETILEDGLKARTAVENSVCIPAVENVAEAVAYMGGIGFESGGCAAAHAICSALGIISETHAYYYGEKLAFCTLVQMIMENAPMDQIDEALYFCLEVGLPVALEDIGVDARDQRLFEAARLACGDNAPMSNMPFKVSPEMVYAAIIGADALGRIYIENY